MLSDTVVRTRCGNIVGCFPHTGEPTGGKSAVTGLLAGKCVSWCCWTVSVWGAKGNVLSRELHRNPGFCEQNGWCWDRLSSSTAQAFQNLGKCPHHWGLPWWVTAAIIMAIITIMSSLGRPEKWLIITFAFSKNDCLGQLLALGRDWLVSPSRLEVRKWVSDSNDWKHYSINSYPCEIYLCFSCSPNVLLCESNSTFPFSHCFEAVA